jgi:hypothetical protein
VTTLNRLVRDAGKNGTGGALICKKRLFAFDAQPFFFARVFMRAPWAINLGRTIQTAEWRGRGGSDACVIG